MSADTKTKTQIKKEHQTKVLSQLILDYRTAREAGKHREPETYAKTIEELQLNTGLDYMEISNAIQFLARPPLPLVTKHGSDKFYYGD